MSRRTVFLILFPLIAVFACIAIIFGLDILRSGVVDTDQAKLMIKEGMTKDEVRSLLGRPREVITGRISFRGERGDAWDYWSTPFGGSILRVQFGRDGRVIERYSWVD